MNDYPQNWYEIATAVKDAAGWKCECCLQPHDVAAFCVITVHHLDGDKANCARWNLAALCPECFAALQFRINKNQLFSLPIQGKFAPWFKAHLEGYEKAQANKRALIATGNTFYGFACAACGHCWNKALDGSTPEVDRIQACPVCREPAFPQPLTDAETLRQTSNAQNETEQKRKGDK